MIGCVSDRENMSLICTVPFQAQWTNILYFPELYFGGFGGKEPGDICCECRVCDYTERRYLSQIEPLANTMHMDIDVTLNKMETTISSEIHVMVENYQIKI